MGIVRKAIWFERDPGFAQYLKEVYVYPLISNQEAREIRAQGIMDETDRNRVVCGCLRWVVMLGLYFNGAQGLEAADLIQVATLRLIENIQHLLMSYDPERDFRKWIMKHIRHSMLDVIRQQNMVIRTIERLALRYPDVLNNIPAREEMSEEEMQYQMQQAQWAQVVQSALAQLNPRERRALQAHYPPDEGSANTTAEVAAELKLEDWHVRKIRQRAIKKLREYVSERLEEAS